MSSTRGSIENLLDGLCERRDRRACARTTSPLLTYVDLGEGNGGIALNIGEGGFAITAAGTLLEDYFPNIRFQLPKIPGWIETSGRVAWTSESKKGAGISFDGITEVDRQKIRHWISSKASHGEVEASYDLEKKHLSDSARRKREPRKLEVLSEADEARFAAMFPSESILRIAPDHNWMATEAEREIPDQVEQNTQDIAKDLGHDTNRRDLDPQSLVEQSSPSAESISAPNHETSVSEHVAIDSEPESHGTIASDVPFTADESVDTIVFPRRRWIIDRPEDAYPREDLPTEDARIAQLEAVNSILDQDRIHSEANEVQTPLPNHDEGTPRESPAMEEKTPGEWALPTFTNPQEADWRQQFIWNRGGAAAESAAPLAVEKGPESGGLLRILGVVVLVCIAGGLMVGSGSLRKLLGLHSSALATDPPAASAAESNSPKSTEPLVSETQRPKNENESPPMSQDGFSNKPTNASTDARAARNESPSPVIDTAQSAETDNDQVPPASNRRPQTRSLPSSSNAVSSGVVKSESPAKTEQTAPTVPTAVPPAPESGLRSQYQENSSTPGYSEATIDKPYSELQSPVLVTPPDEKSGPFRLAFPETAVSASQTLAISAQRFVSIPVQSGPASSHRPERLQAGVLIYHVDPAQPASGEKIGGTVKVRATIGKGGDVVDVRAISGPPSLIPRVVRAVREWRYTVTLLDGLPLGAEEDVVVEFRPKG